MDDPDLQSVRAPVTLRCSVTVDGRELAATQEVSRSAWDDEPLRPHLEGMVRGALETIVMRETRALPDYTAVAAAPIQVHVPTEHEDEVYRAILAKAEQGD